MRLLATSQYSFHQNTAIAIQSELAKIGIKVTLDLPDWASRMSKTNNGDYDFTVLGSLGEITDADWLSNYYYGGDKLVRTNNSPYFNDAKINELLDKGRSTVDKAERAKIYDEFVDRALELSPLVYFMWREQSYAVKKGVTGFTNMPGFLTFQSGFSIENTKSIKLCWPPEVILRRPIYSDDHSFGSAYNYLVVWPPSTTRISPVT